jgi:phosphate transport system substrate-binding protein
MQLLRLLGIALLSVCGVSVAYAEADLKIYGSNTVGAKLGPALAKEWLTLEGYEQVTEEKKGTEIILKGLKTTGASLEVEFDSKGSSTGFKALKSKKAHIGMSSRPIKSSEVAALKSFGQCDTPACEYVAALDGIAVIVNPKNPLSKIRKATLKRLFSGEVTDWEQIGGKPGPVHVYALDNNSGTYDTFKSLVLGKGGALVAGAKRNASHAAISDMVAKDPNAIGFVGLPFVRNSMPVAVSDGQAKHIAPNSFTVATEDYVLARRLFFYLPEVVASPLAKRFVDFTVSDAGQRIVQQVGFISQEVLAGGIELDKDAPQEYRKLTGGAERLSLNFRFLPGSTKLDNKAQRDVGRLKAYMNNPKNRKRELMLFGFADSNETMPIVSLQLSTDRADNVADLLVKQGLRPGKVRGYGNVVPVASNDNKAGRSKNRRVEVWVR